MKNFLAKLVPGKTTAAGIGGLIAVGVGIYVNPATLFDPQTIAAIATSIGLLKAKDDTKKAAAVDSK